MTLPASTKSPHAFVRLRFSPSIDKPLPNALILRGAIGPQAHILTFIGLATPYTPTVQVRARYESTQQPQEAPSSPRHPATAKAPSRVRVIRRGTACLRRTTSIRLNRPLVHRDTAGRDVTTRRFQQRHRGGIPPVTLPSRRRNRPAIARTVTDQAATKHLRLPSPVSAAVSPDDSLRTPHQPTPWSTTITPLTAAMVHRPSMRMHSSLQRTRSGMGQAPYPPAMAAIPHQWPRLNQAMSTRTRLKH